MSLKDAAAEEAYLKTLLDVVNAAYQTKRKQVQSLLEESNTQRVAAALPDGTTVAMVSLVKGSAEAQVVDETAFKAWVMEHYDSEIERRFVAEVRGAFRTKLLAQMTAANSAEWADPETGVIHEVPGVAIRPARARGHSVRMTQTGPSDVMDAWRNGLLAAAALPQLAAGPLEPAAGEWPAAGQGDG